MAVIPEWQLRYDERLDEFAKIAMPKLMHLGTYRNSAVEVAELSYAYAIEMMEKRHEILEEVME